MTNPSLLTQGGALFCLYFCFASLLLDGAAMITADATKTKKYFDVYGPWIKNRYGDVFYDSQAEIALPAKILSQFQGRQIIVKSVETSIVMDDSNAANGGGGGSGGGGGGDGGVSQQHKPVPASSLYTGILTATLLGKSKSSATSSKNSSTAVNSPRALKLEVLLVNIHRPHNMPPSSCGGGGGHGDYDGDYDGLTDAAPFDKVAKGNVLANGVDLSLVLDASKQLATMYLEGPSDVWFGVGLNASQMADLPYTITIDGHTGALAERKLGDHSAGAELRTTATVISNDVYPPEDPPPKMLNHWGYLLKQVNTSDYHACQKLCDNTTNCVAWTYFPDTVNSGPLVNRTCYMRRTLGQPEGTGFTPNYWVPGIWSGEVAKEPRRKVVLTRSLQGAASPYFSFNINAGTLPLIVAHGLGPNFGFHGADNCSATHMTLQVGNGGGVYGNDVSFGNVPALPCLQCSPRVKGDCTVVAARAGHNASLLNQNNSGTSRVVISDRKLLPMLRYRVHTRIFYVD